MTDASPGFRETPLNAKGMSPPYCRECVHAANLQGLALVRMKYGAYAFLNSSCLSYEMRVGSDARTVTKEEAETEIGRGLEDLRK